MSRIKTIRIEINTRTQRMKKKRQLISAFVNLDLNY